MPEDKSVIVTVGDEALPRIHGLAAKLSAQGMKIVRVMPVTGVISGSVSRSRLNALRSIAGVESVEEELSAYPSDE